MVVKLVCFVKMNLYHNNFEESAAAAAAVVVVVVGVVLVSEIAFAADMRTAAVGNLVGPSYNCTGVPTISVRDSAISIRLIKRKPIFAPVDSKSVPLRVDSPSYPRIPKSLRLSL